MPNEFNQEKCRQRNRVAGLRDGIEVAGVTLLDHAPEAVDLLECAGDLPVTLSAAMDAINAGRKRGEELTPEDVYLHYAEAANDGFIPSRYMFLHESTLKNIAAHGAEGVAFMNSHRTGGMSHPSEQPFGHTFAGQYQKYKDAEGKTRKRACLGVYMLKGVKPAGEQGPSTDDLHRMIEGGTTRDVSVGLNAGDRICDICGHDLTATKPTDWGEEKLCPHVPGSTHKLSDLEMSGQKERDPKTRGRATFSYHDGGLGELSSVFNGAVPGAGFKKALRLFRQGELSLAAVDELRDSYAGVITLADFRSQSGPEGMTVEDYAAALMTFWGEEPATATCTGWTSQTFTVSNGTNPPPAGGASFADHASQVLATVEALTERIQGYAALRERDGRGVSLDRRAEWVRLHALLSEVLTATEPPASNAARLRALKLKSLVLRAGAPLPAKH